MAYSLTPYRTLATKFMSRAEALNSAREAIRHVGLTDTRAMVVEVGSRFYAIARGTDAMGFVKRADQ